RQCRACSNEREKKRPNGPRKPMEDRKCVFCESNFETNRAAQKYCSRHCGYLAKLSKNRPESAPQSESTKARVNDTRLKSLYGITSDFWENYKKAVENKCEICGKITDLVIDHSHESGKFRGALCRRHNFALGFLDDDITLFEAAIAYLRKNENE
ncbi:MAG: endonuclease VII domain-containing protein, partial [Actinobacteria bacterium]|nr:endonuclease VII domain-containing protein [Actinomycetota bacterium]